MRRILSSGKTFLMKFVFPTLWIGGFATATLLMFAGSPLMQLPDPPTDPELKWLFLGGTILGGLCWYWWCIRLKRVAVDDQWLYVSNYRREIRVPLRDIEDVSENRLVNIRPITVSFRRETEFGNQVVFMPESMWWLFWRAHPTVADLRVAVRQAHGLPPVRPAA